MNIVKTFNGQMIDVGNCMGCTIVNSFENRTFNVGQIAKTKNFTIAQDFELPINGFIVISSVRHILTINEMTTEEKHELIELIDTIVSSLKKLNVCSQYNVIWEEKDNNHFHAWLVPRHKYLQNAIGSNFIKRMGELFDSAKNNLRTEENLKEINETINKLKNELKLNSNFKDLTIY